ncbi:hypothetical protein BRADI_2g05545v3 [Brachypodium distachyon]|uniref:Uncharacterized protein n=1 Tax=Brachypodium distachyon TaxID=15368 RepID=A0A0Q3FXT0_BRADI|nr:hypothetical protein BRADI_2g05545v3 [Brachypodium distachyon]
MEGSWVFGGLTEESEHTRWFPSMQEPCWELRVLTLSLGHLSQRTCVPCRADCRA